MFLALSSELERRGSRQTGSPRLAITNARPRDLECCRCVIRQDSPCTRDYHWNCPLICDIAGGYELLTMGSLSFLKAPRNRAMISGRWSNNVHALVKS